MNEQLNIPLNCSHVKIDIGLSYTAPISNKWLVKESDVFVLGFEPNPYCCKMIMTSNYKPTPFPDFNLEKKFIEQGRFKLLPYALSDVKELTHQNFFINKNDYGTSSLYTHDQTKLGPIENVINVSVINLKMILDLFPWDRFEYIDYIKIDAQGSDLKILKGAGDYLRERIVYVTAEPDGHYYNGCEDCSEDNIDKFMISQGFKRIKHPNTVDPTYINLKFEHLKDKIWIHQCGPWPC
jgi:FkbM family methyltransferase